MLSWFKKSIAKKWIRELQANVDGIRKMSMDYRSQGGFKEVAETLEKMNAGELVPKDLLDKGRKAELNFADACEELANCYQQLLDIIREKLEKQ